MHFAMDGLILLKESPEAMDQIEVRLSGRWVNVGYGGLFFFKCWFNVESNVHECRLMLMLMLVTVGSVNVDVDVSYYVC